MEIYWLHKNMVTLYFIYVHTWVRDCCLDSRPTGLAYVAYIAYITPLRGVLSKFPHPPARAKLLGELMKTMFLH